MNPTTFTILIVTWNRANPLKRAFDSILSQTLMPNEVVVVNNNSSDDTWKVLEDYRLAFDLKAVIFTVINLPYNMGCPPARNIGLMNCNSDFIYSLDDDGFLESKALNEMNLLINELDEEPYVIASEIRAPDGSIITQYSTSIERKYNFSAGACLISRKAIKEGYIFPNYFRQMEESNLLYRLWANDKPVYVNPRSVMYHDKTIKGRTLHIEVRLNYINEIKNIASQVRVPDAFLIFVYKSFRHLPRYISLKNIYTFSIIYDSVYCAILTLFNKREMNTSLHDYLTFTKGGRN